MYQKVFSVGIFYHWGCCYCLIVVNTCDFRLMNPILIVCHQPYTPMSMFLFIYFANLKLTVPLQLIIQVSSVGKRWAVHNGMNGCDLIPAKSLHVTLLLFVTL